MNNIPSSVKTLNVKLNYTVRNCSSVSVKPCGETFHLLKREVNSVTSITNLRINYQTEFKRIASITPEAGEMVEARPATVGPQSTFSGTFQRPATSGVYISIKVHSVCLAVYSFEVSYGTCSAQGVNLVKFKETIPPVNSSSARIRVNGTCVKHAVPSPSSSGLYAFCDSSGVWTAGANVSCVCDAGYQQNVAQNICEGE